MPFYFFRRCVMRVGPIMILIAYQGILEYLKKSRTDQRAYHRDAKNVCAVGFSCFLMFMAPWVFLCCRLVQDCEPCAESTPPKLFDARLVVIFYASAPRQLGCELRKDRGSRSKAVTTKRARLRRFVIFRAGLFCSVYD